MSCIYDGPLNTVSLLSLSYMYMYILCTCTHVHVHCNWLCFYIALPYFFHCTCIYLGTAWGIALSAETPDQREEFWAPEDERLIHTVTYCAIAELDLYVSGL